MNTTNKRLLFVGLNVILWSIWLSRNDNVFNKKTNLILYAGSVQDDILDKNMTTIQKRRRAGGTLKCTPLNGDNDNEDFCKTWMVV
jgi:hypothetical protein